MSQANIFSQAIPCVYTTLKEREILLLSKPCLLCSNQVPCWFSFYFKKLRTGTGLNYKNPWTPPSSLHYGRSLSGVGGKAPMNQFSRHSALQFSRPRRSIDSLCISRTWNAHWLRAAYLVIIFYRISVQPCIPCVLHFQIYKSLAYDYISNRHFLSIVRKKQWPTEGDTTFYPMHRKSISTKKFSSNRLPSCRSCVWKK